MRGKLIPKIILTEKLCRRCNTTKPIEAFGRTRSRACGAADWCKECMRIRSRERYEKDGWKRTQEYNTARRLLYYDRVTEYLKTHPCVDCGESDPIVLEFDHPEGKNKKYDVSAMMGKVSWKKIEKEIRKCEVVCANCHRRRTAKQCGWRRYRQSQGQIKSSAEGVK